jgi:D-alanyl-D-alanine carboxypeptidase
MSYFSGDASPTAIVPPHGLDEICTTFGDIFGYVAKDLTLDAEWHTEFLTRVALPFPMTISWDHSQSVSTITCHKRLATVFTDVFERIQGSGLQNKITSFGGCFSFRPQRTGTKLSTHAWGIAIDPNPEMNQQGSTGNMDTSVITVFREAGFKWGGGLAGRHARSNAFPILHRILSTTCTTRLRSACCNKMNKI